MGIFDHSSRRRPGSQSLLQFIPQVFYRVGVRPVKFIHTKLSSKWSSPTSLGMLKHSEFLSLELMGQAQLLNNNPTP